jgi:hypothetical protein
MIMDLPSGHIFTNGFQPYGGDSASIVLSAYNQQSLGLTGALAFTQLQPPFVSSLVRWGSEGFAFVGQGSTPYISAVYLLTSSLAKPVVPDAVPVLKFLAPSSLPVGSQVFQLTLDGLKFVEGAVVNWNGGPLPTTYVDATVLTAIVPASDLATSGTASVTVTNPAPGGGTSHALKFTISPLVPLISFSTSALTFPAQAVGTASVAQTVAVQNPGTATLAIGGIAITGTNAASFSETSNCGSSLPAGANCLISVVFKPGSTGSLTASLGVTDNAAGSPQTISVAGTGK